MTILTRIYWLSGICRRQSKSSSWSGLRCSHCGFTASFVYTRCSKQLQLLPTEALKLRPVHYQRQWRIIRHDAVEWSPGKPRIEWSVLIDLQIRDRKIRTRCSDPETYYMVRSLHRSKQQHHSFVRDDEIGPTRIFHVNGAEVLYYRSFI